MAALLPFPAHSALPSTRQHTHFWHIIDTPQRTSTHHSPIGTEYPRWDPGQIALLGANVGADGVSAVRTEVRWYRSRVSSTGWRPCGRRESGSPSTLSAAGTRLWVICAASTSPLKDFCSRRRCHRQICRSWTHRCAANRAARTERATPACRTRLLRQRVPACADAWCRSPRPDELRQRRAGDAHVPVPRFDRSGAAELRDGLFRHQHDGAVGVQEAVPGHRSEDAAVFRPAGLPQHEQPHLLGQIHQRGAGSPSNTRVSAGCGPATAVTTRCSRRPVSHRS